MGVGDRDTNNPGGGEVYIKSASTVGNPSDSGWSNTNLLATSSGGRVRAITYGYHNGNSTTSQTILAAVEDEGVYRYHNGSWSQSNGITIGATKRTRFLWPDNSNSEVVYLLDLYEGLYRSNDGGQNWSNIWTSMNFNNNDFFNTGYITADNNNPTTIYLSIQGRSGSPIGTNFKVYRMTGANTGVFGEPGTTGITDITFHSGNTVIRRPGPLVFGPDGRLWLTQQQNSVNSIYAGLFVMENPTTDLSFTDITTNAYQNIAIQPSSIDVSSDGYIYMSQNGKGLVKIKVMEDTSLDATENQLDNNGITIYPVPTSNEFIFIKSKIETIGTIKVYNMTGRIILEKNIDSTHGKLNISGLSSGIYMLKTKDKYVRFIVK